MDLGDIRREYGAAALLPGELSADPLEAFDVWFRAASAAGILEPNAMTLATATADGVPSARIVLLKGVEAAGFVFFTNYHSQKGRELARNPHAALCFHWPSLERQIRVAGTVHRLDRVASLAYFRTRPRGSQLGAWASHQSEPIAGREVLEAELQRQQIAFSAGEIPLPPHWGGFVLTPEQIEFWQGRADRLHDRLLYTRTETGWDRARLSP